MKVRNINRQNEEIDLAGKTPKIEDFPEIYRILQIMEGEQHGEL